MKGSFVDSSTTIFIFGAVASILFIVSNYVLNRNLVIILQTAAISVLVLQYSVVMGLFAIAILNAMFIVRNFFFYIKKWERFYPLFGVISLIIFTAVYVWLQIIPDLNTTGTVQLATIFPLLAAWFSTIALAQINIFRLKVFFAIASLSWVMFDIVLGLWGNIIGDGFSFIAGLIAISRIVWLERKSNSELR